MTKRLPMNPTRLFTIFYCNSLLGDSAILVFNGTLTGSRGYRKCPVDIFTEVHGLPRGVLLLHGMILRIIFCPFLFFLGLARMDSELNSE